jgi:hypothetical protein
MHFTCWITKVADTFRIYATYCFSMLSVVTHTCLSVTFYGRCLSYYISHYPSLNVTHFGLEYCVWSPGMDFCLVLESHIYTPAPVSLLVVDPSMYQARPPSTLCPWVMYKDTVSMPCVISGSHSSLFSFTNILQTFLSASLPYLLLQAYWQLEAGCLGLVSQTHKPFLTPYC